MTAPVSVVIPTFNAVAFIRETLDSVFGQTLPPQEVVVVDDASTDGTAELVAELARTAPVPLRLLRNNRNCGGPARPLNRGIAEAKSEVIATLDHDDLMVPNRLELQVRCLEHGTGIGLVIGWCEALLPREPIIDWTGPVRKKVESIPRLPLETGCFRITARDAYSALVHHGAYAMTCSAFLFPRSVWRSCGGFDESLRTALDFAFHQRVVQDHDLGLVDAPVARWRLRADSLSRGSSGLFRCRQELEVYHRFDPARLTPSARQALPKYIHEITLAAAYFSRQEADYRGALAYYLTSFRKNGVSLDGAVGLVKLPLHRLLRFAGMVGRVRG